VETVHDEAYVLYVRRPGCPAGEPEAVEVPVVSCASYEEARRLKQEWSHHGRVCIIRYVGASGGGD
jgi:hypothetical protein